MISEQETLAHQVRFPRELSQQITNWRRQQDRIQTLSDAVRSLVQAGLDAMAESEKDRAA